MTAARHHPAPPALLKRGLTEAAEVTPVAGDFRVSGAGKRIGVLFRAELLQRQAARAARRASA